MDYTEEEIERLTRITAIEDSIDTQKAKWDANIPGGTPPGYVDEYGMPVPLKEDARYSPKRWFYYSQRRPEGEGNLDPNLVSPKDFEIVEAATKGDGIFGSGAKDSSKVRLAQQVLFKHGFIDHVNEIDGEWGPKTEGAIRRFVGNDPNTLERRIMRFFKDL